MLIFRLAGVIILVLTALLRLSAQQIITEKIERKISLSPFAGVAFFPQNVNINDLGLPQNLFSGYAPAPAIGVTGWYKYKKRTFLGTEANMLITARDINSLNAIGISALAKLNLMPPKYKFTPYVVAGFNVSFINLNQPKQIKEYFPEEEDSLIIGEGIKPQKIEYKYNKLNLMMTPLAGPVGGAGFEFKVSRKVSVYAQGMVQTSFGKNYLIQSTFPENQSVFQYLSVRGGANIKLYKRMKFEIDTNAVRIPDPIALLYPEELNAEAQQMLSREGNFSVNLREGLRHTLQVSIKGSEINILMDNEDGPCKTLAILYDQFGNKIASALPDETGNVNFINLEKGVYNVAFEVQPPCPHTTSLSYKINDPGIDIASQFAEEYTPQTDSLAYNIDGFVDFKDTPLPPDGITVMLVDQETKMVIAKQQTTPKGEFSFKSLNPGDYKVVYEVGNPKTQSRMAYKVEDTKKKIIKQENFPFNPFSLQNKEGTRLMGGQIALNDPGIAAYKVNLNLVDKYNRVVDHSIPNEDGTFEFIDRKSDKNEIIYELGDKKVEKEVLAALEKGQKPAPLVRSISYDTKVANAEEGQKIISSTQSMLAEKALAATVEAKAEMEMYKYYNSEGDESTVTGFGFQVGAFRSLENVKNMVDKLESKGFDAYIQVVMSGDISGRFKTTTNYKLHRIIVYGSGDELTANEIRHKLESEGYPIIVKERFKPANQYTSNSTTAAGK